jgi:hypothetical protein
LPTADDVHGIGQRRVCCRNLLILIDLPARNTGAYFHPFLAGKVKVRQLGDLLDVDDQFSAAVAFPKLDNNIGATCENSSTISGFGELFDRFVQLSGRGVLKINHTVFSWGSTFVLISQEGI